MNEKNFCFVFMLLMVVTISAILVYLQNPRTARAGRAGYQQMVY